MSHIAGSIEIDAPPAAVFAVMVDLDRIPEWSTVAGSTSEGPGRPLRPGDTFRQALRVLGQEVEADWRVEDLDAPHLVAYEAAGPAGARLRMTQRVADAGGGRSRVDLEIDYELPGGFLGGMVDKLYPDGRNEQEVDDSLRNLKGLVEAPPGAGTA